MNLDPKPNLSPIYKFRSLNSSKVGNGLSDEEKTFDIINNNRLWFAHHKSFNDPFDCSIELIDFNFTESETNDVLSRVSTRRERRFFSKQKKFREELGKDRGRFFGEKLMEPWGICPFSKTKKNLLLWSHYADSHRGLCFKFDPIFDKDTFRNLEVKYTKEFEVASWSRHQEKSIIHLITTKYISWQYEQEIRSWQDNLIDGNGKISRLKSFNKNCLKEICFGLGCDDKQIDVVKQLVEKAGYENIEFFKAKRSKLKFELDFEPV